MPIFPTTILLFNKAPFTLRPDTKYAYQSETHKDTCLYLYGRGDVIRATLFSLTGAGAQLSLTGIGPTLIEALRDLEGQILSIHGLTNIFIHALPPDPSTVTLWEHLQCQ